MAKGDLYTVHLIVRAEQLDGGEIEWDQVAGFTAKSITKRLTMSKPRARFRMSAEIDSAEEEG